MAKEKPIHYILPILTLGLYLYYLNYVEKNAQYIGTKNTQKETFISTILWAVVAASVLRSLIFEAFLIPTSSLEKTLLVGDFLFVSRLHYGTRMPMTALSVPLTHRELPIVKKKSFLNFPKYPYIRFPAFQSIENNDLVVFNYPGRGPEDFFQPFDNDNIDKKLNYVKRCIAIAGDTLEIRDNVVYINGKESRMPENAVTQMNYTYSLKSGTLNDSFLNKQYDVTEPIRYPNGRLTGKITLNKNNVDAIKNIKNITQLVPEIHPRGIADPNIFPAGKKWNRDNYGPLYIPKKGDVIQLNSTNYEQYRRIIEKHEGNTVIRNGNTISINGKETDTYTVKQNYYFMTGDNRHNSDDSRFWGYVPEDHILGKPVLIWMSIKNINDGISKWQPRWNRMLTLVNTDGSKRVSVLPYLLGFILLFYGWKFYKKRKRMKNH